MYSIVKEDGAELGLTEQPNYIFLQENGFYALCAPDDASGVCYAGNAYHLAGRPEMKGTEETVYLAEVDAGEDIEDHRRVMGIAFVTLAEDGKIDNVTAGEHVGLFAEWAYPIAYTVGQIRRYGGELYRCVQAHTSQEDWTPDKTASLWSKTADPAEEWPEWSQPVGAHDAYGKGDKVTHNGQHYTSTVDANVWEPGVYGWQAEE